MSSFQQYQRKERGGQQLCLHPGSSTLNGMFHELRMDVFGCLSSFVVRPKASFLLSETPKPGGIPIEHGDLVIWQAAKAPPLFGKGKVGSLTGDKRSSWFGFVVAKIAPEIDEDGRFTILCRYQ
jgi:hypothetical protein